MRLVGINKMQNFITLFTGLSATLLESRCRLSDISCCRHKAGGAGMPGSGLSRSCRRKPRNDFASLQSVFPKSGARVLSNRENQLLQRLVHCSATILCAASC